MTRATWQSLARWGALVAVLGLAVTSGCKEKEGRKTSRRKGTRELGTGPGGLALPPGVKLKPAAQGRIAVAFLGFGQTSDAKQRTVRFAVHNRSTKAVRSVRLLLKYRSETGKPRGQFPLHVVRPGPQQLAPGGVLKDTFELLGHEGPPEEVASVLIDVQEVAFADGTTWRAGKGP